MNWIDIKPKQHIQDYLDSQKELREYYLKIQERFLIKGSLTDKSANETPKQ